MNEPTVAELRDEMRATIRSLKEEVARLTETKNELVRLAEQDFMTEACKAVDRLRAAIAKD